MVFKAAIGEGVVIEPAAKVIGVTIAPHHYVPAGMTVTDQKVADKLPLITDDYPFRSLNDAVVHVNTGLAASYGKAAKDVEAALLKKNVKEGAGTRAAEGKKGAAEKHPKDEKKEAKETGGEKKEK
jgi:hypothetical protein